MTCYYGHDPVKVESGELLAAKDAEIRHLRETLEQIAKLGPDSYWRDFAREALNVGKS